MLRIGATVLAAALVLSPARVGAQSTEDRLEQARRDRRAAEGRLGAISADLGGLTRRYAEVETRANRAAGRLIDAYLRETTIRAELAEARALLEGRADAIYRAGPGAFLEVLFESSSLGDLVSRGELVEAALLSGVEEAEAALQSRSEAHEARRELDRSRRALVLEQRRLQELRTVMEIRLAAARSEARRAGVRVQALLEQHRQLIRAAAAEQRIATLVAADGALYDLLEALGPTGGRGCAIPSGLERSGQTFSGQASFYGEGFAGDPTAIGHIFNPALFTAAHRTLPLPSFLHVRYGSRCATVVVNDRGPYVEGRVLDLSHGVAEYLGLVGRGVGPVRAEVLLRRSS